MTAAAPWNPAYHPYDEVRRTEDAARRRAADDVVPAGDGHRVAVASWIGKAANEAE